MKIAVMGYGTIGSGVVEVLEINKEKIAKRAGEPIEVKYVLDLREFPGTPIENKIVHDYKVIAEDPEIGIVVETMGGVEPAFTFVKAMLEAGKQVATSNKNLVAAKGAELIKIARDHGVNFQFEASVGGGIPIIRPLNKCLTADEIEEITGILNGTTNYMLTKMTEEGADFDEVLKDAQDKGYAEKDPTADIERDLYYKKGHKGDSAVVHRTDVLRRYPFFVAEGEKFMAEPYVYHQIDQEYVLGIVDAVLIVREYLKDGYTYNIRRITKQNPLDIEFSSGCTLNTRIPCI